MRTLHHLMSTLPQRGRVEWIGVRPARRQPMNAVDSVVADPLDGLQNDRYSTANGKRQVTLIQAEHVTAVSSMLGERQVGPEMLRRNLIVRGINLLALKDKSFRVGSAILECTGLCHPCSLMEDALGPGGYNAMRGHGGITAKITVGGIICVTDEVLIV